MLRGEAKEAIMDDEGVLRIKGRVCVPRVDDLIHTILTEAHSSRYSIHPGATKMYRDLKQHFWWSRMKRDIVEFVTKCPNCQQVKYEHQRPGGTLQRMPIPEWKWERIAMDFVVGLPKTLGKFDSIWVIVDRLTKSAHFIPVKVTYNAEKLAKLYISEVVRLHGVPLSIIYRIVVRSLLLCFGKHCMLSWVLGWILVLHFTLRPMVSLSERFKCWRICFVHV